MTSIPDTETATADADDSGARPGIGRRRVRASLTALCAIVAVVAVLATTLAVWAHQTLFSSASVANAVDSALSDPQVTDALAGYLTDQAFTIAAVDERVGNLLPDALEPLAPAISGGARVLVRGQLASALSSESARDVVGVVVVRSHDALMRLLEGDGLVAGVSVVDGEVSVNLLPLVAGGLRAVQEYGLLQRFTIPEFRADGDPAEQIAELEALLRRDLPDDTGQLIVYRSEALAEGQQTLAAVQRALVVFKRGVALLAVVAILAFVGAVAFAQRRRRMAMILLVAIAVVMLVVRMITSRIVAEVPTLVLQPGARAALGATVSALTGGLFTLIEVLAVIVVIAAVGLWASGSGASAIRMRAWARSVRQPAVST